jgi:4-hydroxy-2-oxoheptanedioate aldolase
MAHSLFVQGRTDAGPLMGGWVTLEALPVLEVLVAQGFDYIGIDTQHSMIDVTAAVKLRHAVPLDGPPVVIRAPANDHAVINKILDCGADGVIVPMVNTAGQAAAAVAACLYPPAGTRSFGPIRDIAPDHRTLEHRGACFAMIETSEALDNVEAIARVPGLTGLYLGPADLALSLGHTPSADPDFGPMKEPFARIAIACRNAGIIAGCHGLSPEHGGALGASGYAMVSLSSDKAYLRAGAASALSTARAAAHGRSLRA